MDAGYLWGSTFFFVIRFASMAANVLLLQGKIRILQVTQVSLAADSDKHVVGFLVSSKKM